MDFIRKGACVLSIRLFQDNAVELFFNPKRSHFYHLRQAAYSFRKFEKNNLKFLYIGNRKGLIPND